MHGERHPTMFELEAHHVGEGRASTARHVLVCRPCAAYVRSLEEEAATFRERARPGQFVATIRRRAGTARARHWSFSFLLPVVGALGVAAVCFASLGPALGPTPAPTVPSGQADELRARGGPTDTSVTVILSDARDGHQTRHVTDVDARPGDRFRVEVTVARATQLDTVLVEDSGARTSLGPRQRFVAGTHLLEPTFIFDDRPFSARVVVGPPEGIARVLAGQPDARVGSLRIRVAGRGPPPPDRESAGP